MRFSRFSPVYLSGQNVRIPSSSQTDSSSGQNPHAPSIGIKTGWTRLRQGDSVH